MGTVSPVECGCAQCAALRTSIRYALKRLDAKPYSTALRQRVESLRLNLRTMHTANPTN